MITNNMIRNYLNLPLAVSNFEIKQVDSLRDNRNSLMFINKLGVDLQELDNNSIDCMFLVDERYPETLSMKNDFIKVRNSKFVFCRIVDRFNIQSRLQLEHDSPIDISQLEDIYCEEVIIGENCHIDHGAIIGGIDFSPVMGYDRSELVQFPQLGGVILGDNVVVKYNTMIGRGTFGYTEIGDSTMIDYGCQIGHNCVIGKSCIIAAGSIIGGSTTVGDNTVIGIGSKIRNGIRIGKNVSVGMGSVVIKDIPDNCVVVGNPARIIEHKQIFDEGGLV